MLDMSKAFNTVNRQKTNTLDELSKTIDTDELFIINIMLNTELQVRCGNHTSDFFETDTGVPQGDGLSANQFTYYLAKALSFSPHQDHSYYSLQPQTPKQITLEHHYLKPINKTININQEDADDISFISSNPNEIKHNKNILPAKS